MVFFGNLEWPLCAPPAQCLSGRDFRCNSTPSTGAQRGFESRPPTSKVRCSTGWATFHHNRHPFNTTFTYTFIIRFNEYLTQWHRRETLHILHMHVLSDWEWRFLHMMSFCSRPCPLLCMTPTRCSRAAGPSWGEVTRSSHTPSLTTARYVDNDLDILLKPL